MAKKSALGSAFDSIFDDFDNLSGDNDSGKMLKINEIEPNREQPRKDFDPEKITALADSISKHGLIQPVVVRPFEGGYRIVAGERRWRAARQAGLTEIPVRIIELTDAETMQIALIENLHREDLNPVEEAAGFRELIDTYHMTQDDVAKTMGKARSSVTNSLRLLSLPDEVLALVRSGELSKGHCKAIMSAGERMVELAKRAVAGELSVRETERLVKKSASPKKNAPKKRNAFFAETELALAQALDTGVRIVEGRKKLTLCIDFSDEEELKHVIKGMKL